MAEIGSHLVVVSMLPSRREPTSNQERIHRRRSRRFLVMTFAQLSTPHPMMKQPKILLCVLMLMSSAVVSLLGYPLIEDEKASRPMPGPYRHVWLRFYDAGSEGAIAPALVAGGRRMVPHICRAVRDSRMYCRRYALLALGHLKDRRSLLTLETIYSDTDEDSLFRGDALEAIFVIDQKLGRFYAKRVLARELPENDYLRATARRIFDTPADLLTLPVES